jgi:hypothetical protein
VRASARAHPWLLASFVPLVAVLVAAAVIAEAAGKGATFFFEDFEPGRFYGGVTVVAASAMVVAGALLAFAGRWLAVYGGEGRQAWPWVAMGATVAYLALDDLAKIHEVVHEKLEAHNVPVPFGVTRDAYIFGIYGLVVLVVAASFVPRLRGLYEGAAFFALGVVAAASSVVVDLIPSEDMSSQWRALVGSFEEIDKVVAEYALLLFALLTAEEVIRRSVGKAEDPGGVVERGDRPSRVLAEACRGRDLG